MRLKRKRNPEPIRRPSSLKMRLKNYRLFEDSGWFTIAPLTCLVGRNSSGKSSIISSILLLKQSVEQEGRGWGAGTPLILSGQYCDLGNYVDLVHNHHESAEISLSFSVSFKDLEQALTDRRAVPIVNLSIPRQRPFYGGGYYPDLLGRSVSMLPKRGSIEVHLSFSAEEPFGPSIRGLEVIAENIGSASFTRTPQKRRRPVWKIRTTVLPPQSLAIETYPRTFFPIVRVQNSSFRKCGKPMRRRIQRFIRAIRLFWSFLQQGLLRSESVGPFRTPPERRYAFGGFGASRGGPSGEQAIDLLITETLLRPHGVRTRSLHSALSFWIKHLKLADSLDIKDIAKRLNLFQVQITGAGRSSSARGTTSNLADVGFGVSQVLPVLVQGLLMRPGGVYLVQQPEIHLHPDAQAGLADFFIYLASYGIITVVETHSEYLLLRIRRRLAEGASPIKMGIATEVPNIKLRPNDISVLFTGFEDKVAVVKQLFIGSSFQFENLPSGFMSQALEDRVKLLKAVGKENA